MPRRQRQRAPYIQMSCDIAEEYTLRRLRRAACYKARHAYAMSLLYTPDTPLLDADFVCQMRAISFARATRLYAFFIDFHRCRQRFSLLYALSAFAADAVSMLACRFYAPRWLPCAISSLRHYCLLLLYIFCEGEARFTPIIHRISTLRRPFIIDSLRSRISPPYMPMPMLLPFFFFSFLRFLFFRFFSATPSYRHDILR